MSARQPLALSLSGFQFTYRSSYFDWRLLHGIDVDTVIRLTDVQAVEDCLDTLQRGAFSAERDRLSPANCVQLFRLLQLAVEYCGHLRGAHAALLDCYNGAMEAAESWKSAALSYLDVGSMFLSEALAPGGGLSRGGLDATDGAKAALEAADREYNAALDALEAEDSRARHFRFRKQRTEISWSQLHAADADRLVASLDVGLLEGLLPNLTYGNITSEDDEQLTPHHFGQLIPLAQAALDYVLWQANATGALLEQAMAALQAACADIPALTSATQERHAVITSLLLGGQLQNQLQNQIPGGFLTGAVTPTMTGAGVFGGGGGGGGSPMGLGELVELTGYVGGGGGSAVPWASATADMGQQAAQYGSGRLGASPGFARASSPAYPRTGSGGPGGTPQVLRVGPSRLGTPGPSPGPGGMAGGGSPYSGGLAAFLGPGAGGPGPAPSRLMSGGMDELAAAAAAALASGGASASTLPVLELHSRTAELTYKVDAIEQDLRMERGKTEEMRRILTDIRDRLNHQPPAATATTASLGGGGLSPVESLTFPAAASATLEAGMGPGGLRSSNYYSAFAHTPSASAGGGGLRYGSAAGVNTTAGSQVSDPALGPSKVRVFVDEDAIREQERQRAVQVLTRQAERLKEQMLREHQERRLANSVASSVARASLQLQQLGAPRGGGAGKEGPRHSRQASREGRRGAAATRRTSPGEVSRPGSANRAARELRPGATPQTLQTHQMDYGSDPEQAAMSLASAGGSFNDQRDASRRGSGGVAAAAISRPPRPFSRLSGPTMHGSLGDLPAAVAAAPGMYGMAAGGGGGGLTRMAAGSGGQGGGDAMALPPPSSMFASVSVDSHGGGGGGSRLGAAAAPRGVSAIPQAVRLAAASAFGSISLVGPDKEAAAANRVSKTSSSSDRMSYRSVPDVHSLPQGGGGGGGGGPYGTGGGGGRTGATSSGGGGWDAAAAVAAGVAGR